jgi:hypothetical protein
MRLHRSGVIFLALSVAGCGAVACGHDSVPAPTVALGVATSPAAASDTPSVSAVVTSATVPMTPPPNARLLKGLGGFVVASPPAAGHAKGTIAALSYDSADGCVGGVVEMDLATTSEMGRVCLDPADQYRIASDEHGIVVASQSAAGLTVTWLDGGARSIRAKHLVPGFREAELFGFAVIAGRAVIVDGRAHAFVVDSQGRLIARHACPDMLHHPGTAEVVAWGNRGVMTNLNHTDDDGRKIDQPLCAFRVDRSAPTLNVSLPLPVSSVFADQGVLYAADGTGKARKLGDDLRPTGSPIDVPTDKSGPSRAWQAECHGITGDVVAQEQRVEGLWLVHTKDCCGDDAPAGLFVCDPGVAR